MVRKTKIRSEFMTANDIESIAIDTIKRELRKYIKMFTPHLQENDKTPFWDGEIWVYKDANKTKKDYADRIFVQVKGRKVQKISQGNSKFPMEVETLQGFQKDKRGTLLFVTEIEDIEHTQLYYANLLPVDLNEILYKVKPEQKSISIDIKPIKEKTSSLIKFICLNFLKNSNEQLKIAIKNIDDIKNIKEIKVPIHCDNKFIDEYLLNNDIYSYAITQENEKIALPKLKEIVTFKETKQEVKIKDKIYYEKITSVKSRNNEYILLGKSTKFYMNKDKIDFKIQGNLRERINDIQFIIDLVESKFFDTSKGRINFPINQNSESIKFIEGIKKDLKYLIAINNIFAKFGIEFNLDLDILTENDYKNLNLLINIFNGIFPPSITETKLCNIKIAKYKIAFIVLKKENGEMVAYNYFDELDKIIRVFYFNERNEQIPLSIYINMKKTDFLEFSNLNVEIIKKSFKNIDNSMPTIAKVTEFLLVVLNAYDVSNNRELLELAKYVNNKILEYKKEDENIINKLQIIKRERTLSREEKEELYGIKNKNNNTQIQLGIAILLENKSDYERYLEQLTNEEKEIFKTYPIMNLNKVFG
jgi:hypothetical protein